MNEIFYRFGIAAAIGFLIGLQREFASGREAETGVGEPQFAGIRTFTLLGLAGATSAYVGELVDSPWAFFGPLLLVGALLISGYWKTARGGHFGMTTEVAAILVFLTGALCYFRKIEIAVAIGVALMLVLSLKVELHRLAHRLTRDDFIAVIKFGVITAIVLPVLPDQGIGPAPLDVLNPRRIWLMVVLISGLNFLGYGLSKLVGPRQGIGLTGLLGGMASSTAVTLAVSQRSKESGPHPFIRLLGAAILIAWAVMFARVLIEVAVTNRPLLGTLWIPITAAGSAAAVYAVVLYRRMDDDADETAPVSANPFELGPAIKFGLLYAGILLLASMAQQYLGDSGIYISSIGAGLADVDAITLSMAELSRTGEVEMATASTAVTLAALSNTLVKAVIVMVAGSAPLRKVVLPGFVVIVVAGLVGSVLS